jgi:hypothetical protein
VRLVLAAVAVRRNETGCPGEAGVVSAIGFGATIDDHGRCTHSDEEGGPLCGQPAAYTIEWDDGGESSTACVEHAAYLREVGSDRLVSIRTWVPA